MVVEKMQDKDTRVILWTYEGRRVLGTSTMWGTDPHGVAATRAYRYESCTASPYSVSN